MDAFKVEQVAIYAERPEVLIQNLRNALGLSEWVEDRVVANGVVFGQKVLDQIGHLWFNYQTGIELEVLHYPGQNNWHALRDYRGPVHPSHVGYHVKSIAEARVAFERAGWRVAQEVWTQSHTNPYLVERGRKYHYLVWDSRDIIGFDVKLIERIEKGD